MPEVMKEFEETGAILKGHFKLSSGMHSDTYVQCARLLMHPDRSEKLCKLLAARVRDVLGDKKIELVVSPAMGGVVIGYELARQLGVPQIFCERVDGKFEFRRGFEVPKGANILIVEDVVTTAKSSLETVDCITNAGGNVIGEASLIDRSSGMAEKILPFKLVSLLTINVPIYDPANLPEHLAGTEAVKPGSRFLKS